MWFLVQVSGTDDSYYFNPDTQTTSWSRPVGLDEDVPLYHKKYDGPIARGSPSPSAWREQKHSTIHVTHSDPAVKTVARDIFHTKSAEKTQVTRIASLKTFARSATSPDHIISKKPSPVPVPQTTHAASLMEQLEPDIPVGLPPRRKLSLLRQVADAFFFCIWYMHLFMDIVIQGEASGPGIDHHQFSHLI